MVTLVLATLALASEDGAGNVTEPTQLGGWPVAAGGMCPSLYIICQMSSCEAIMFPLGHCPPPEVLPSPSAQARTVEWTEGPLCPLWGPMDSFYEEGIEKGRVSEPG